MIEVQVLSVGIRDSSLVDTSVRRPQIPLRVVFYQRLKQTGILILQHPFVSDWGSSGTCPSSSTSLHSPLRKLSEPKVTETCSKSSIEDNDDQEDRDWTTHCFLCSLMSILEMTGALLSPITLSWWSSYPPTLSHSIFVGSHCLHYIVFLLKLSTLLLTINNISLGLLTSSHMYLYHMLP